MQAPRIDILPITTYIDFDNDAATGVSGAGGAESELHVPSSVGARLTSSPSSATTAPTTPTSRAARSTQTQLSFSELAMLCKSHGHQLLGWKLSEAKVRNDS